MGIDKKSEKEIKQARKKEEAQTSRARPNLDNAIQATRGNIITLRQNRQALNTLHECDINMDRI